MSAPDAAILALDAQRAALAEVEHKILDNPAEGPAGIAVKLDVGLAAMHPDPREKHWDDLGLGFQLIVSALMDASRLAKDDAT